MARVCYQQMSLDSSRHPWRRRAPSSSLKISNVPTRSRTYTSRVRKLLHRLLQLLAPSIFLHSFRSDSCVCHLKPHWFSLTWLKLGCFYRVIPIWHICMKQENRWSRKILWMQNTVEQHLWSRRQRPKVWDPGWQCVALHGNARNTPFFVENVWSRIHADNT